ncbi:unnamed protein product [Brachionus calyciflorus]|uniref:Uncharacterized protein n=1 Tax=Brachionus calyciflorus TaxID=104777 RepID=A0A814JZ21_9BILA|nr:unnamed protein product [Brachionus calyciflorus]
MEVRFKDFFDLTTKSTSTVSNSAIYSASFGTNTYVSDSNKISSSKTNFFQNTKMPLSTKKKIELNLESPITTPLPIGVSTPISTIYNKNTTEQIQMQNVNGLKNDTLSISSHETRITMFDSGLLNSCLSKNHILKSEPVVVINIGVDKSSEKSRSDVLELENMDKPKKMKI